MDCDTTQWADVAMAGVFVLFGAIVVWILNR